MSSLTRSSQDAVIAGVCSGIAHYFSIPNYVVRLIFFCGGLEWLYLILALTLPWDNENFLN
ncbi:PspC domain-containing protein [Levilactobacillus enshiensis]|uniref:PspC domain-containing protein n=1 Tax=Levilactobacillus enshiensis TaxID=2590213 RepID=UPI00117A7A79|nr:PspC domain-containing protein [Levilactobacillus enshiensis]